ncbi:3-phenylpropionate/trans-cinnamate dioxygenase ferredoxin subunit [Arcanobacterium pluranimalium]|uniref:Rieske (2Fe-2S) protein n=1 Tax=Arcanobacterium pluranimalium TaxID=108028 RepID=UPI00195EEC62|nr:non-heme iron oxygenase ferredoxin subunit [Arcanobacterium pluranimalium]MBM7825336.1 3-phenylpropionate/trans-cinnamate dioxygenase ferredoxin subunit [Arcanobacterium pluranimalium]
MTEHLVCETAAVAPGDVAPFTVTKADGETVNIAVVHTENDRWFAVIDRCSHGRFKLSEGDVDGNCIECTRHGSAFDLETGNPLNPPASIPIQTFPVRLAGDAVYVSIASN